ncbi:MAG: acetyl-CoA carboxylase carboxyltransferase subunit alpha, partial [Deferribacteraceae bacterium]|nr:acetyl-CoA carboxylase carboxyltransferase subunit alpha [Deferribacteraceae bacterium]
MSQVTPLDFETPILEIEAKIAELKKVDMIADKSSQASLAALEKRLEKIKKDTYKNLTPTQKVQVARHPSRPYTLDYINFLFTDFVELHGDRVYGDDQAIIGGMAKFNGEPVMVVGHQKGRNTKENIARNFGMAHPEGYRKAVRLFKMASKFKRPIITFIDTPGAYPGLGAEERGQAEAIAKALFEMALLGVPMLSFVIGEGGSGGALGLGMGNRVIMLEHSVYSVISPEGCASILWKDAKFADKAAEALKMTAQDMLELGVADEIVPEPAGGAHRNHKIMAHNIGICIDKHLKEL